MRFASAISEQESSIAAVREAVAEVREALGDEVDVAFLFFTADHLDDAQAVAEEVWLELDPQAVVGCSAEGVIGGDREIERAPGLVVLAGSMPDVRVHGFHIPARDWHDVIGDNEAFAERIGYGPE